MSITTVSATVSNHLVKDAKKTKGKKDFTQYPMFVPVGKTHFQSVKLAEVDFFGG